MYEATGTGPRPGPSSNSSDHSSASQRVNGNSSRGSIRHPAERNPWSSQSMNALWGSLPGSRCPRSTMCLTSRCMSCAVGRRPKSTPPAPASAGGSAALLVETLARPNAAEAARPRVSSSRRDSHDSVRDAVVPVARSLVLLIGFSLPARTSLCSDLDNERSGWPHPGGGHCHPVGGSFAGPRNRPDCRRAREQRAPASVGGAPWGSGLLTAHAHRLGVDRDPDIKID
jgi:hypothetical protein